MSRLLTNEECELLLSLTESELVARLASMPEERRSLIRKELTDYLYPKERAEIRLHEFVKQAWQHVETSAVFVDNWHIEALCNHLEASLDGRINKLLINMPPGCMKSLLTAVFFPMWTWGPKRRPDIRWLFISYDQKLSTRDSRKCRTVLESQWYQSNWGSVFQIVDDQNQKMRFDTDKQGWRIASSVGGYGTGEHPDILVADDYLNAAQARSEVERKSRIEWWDETIPTRGIARGVRQIVIGQRLQEDDISGHLLAAGGWEHICLPMEFETGRMKATSLGWSDPRKEVGELLWPAVFSKARVDAIAREMRPHQAAGQLQQRPTDPQGELFKREWFKPIEENNLPLEFFSKGKAVRYWDKAGTEDGGDFTAGVLIVALEKTWYVFDVVRGQWSAFKREEQIEDTTKKDGKRFTNYKVWHEQEGGSGGKESAERTTRNLAGFGVHSERVTGEKTSRWYGWEAQLEAGNVFIVRDDWNRDFVNEHCAAPNGKHDDQIDAAVGAFMKLSGKKPFHIAFG